MLANIREIAIIVTPSQIDYFKKLLGNGVSLGIKLQYLIQDKPNGIAESLLISENFLGGDKCALILGDNIFHGPGLGRRLSMFNILTGAHIFGYKVKNPESYGIAKLDKDGNILELSEKPVDYNSFDENASTYTHRLRPSERGELEIIDLLKIYHSKQLLKLEMLPRGTAWFDSGTFEDLHDASTYVRLMQDRTGERVGDPNEIAKFLNH